MKSISIDIESFSGINLQKSGVYRYAESDDFEILLFGYSIDSGDIKVVDLARGETIPEEIINALTDDSIEKWAFNAQFERVCLSKFLEMKTGEYLDPTSWHCTMVWAATLGLPLSLEGVGAVLGIENQKLSEGKNLIRYFCIPCSTTKINGGRTRNLPEHDTDKWQQFKSYNLRDVEVELTIQQKLSKFPVSDVIWDEYHLDQEINDRGIGVDMIFVNQAIAIDDFSRNKLTALMQEMTNLDNPNSVQQMRGWLADNGLETDTLGKKAVAEMLKTAPEPLGEVLELRQQLAKSSVKKYTAKSGEVYNEYRAFCMQTGEFIRSTADFYTALDSEGFERHKTKKGAVIKGFRLKSEFLE